MESLKNVVEYRIIQKREIKSHNKFDEVDLMILAPSEYYQSYGLLNKKGFKIKNNLKTVERVLNEFSSAFDIKMSFWNLNIDLDYFMDKCKMIYDELNIEGQKSISISKKHSIPALQVKRWELIAASC